MEKINNLNKVEVERLYNNIPVNPQTGKRQIFIDASALKNSSCFRNLWWTSVEGYQLHGEKNHKLAFGSAIHLFLEDLYKGLPAKDGILRAVEYYKPYNDSLNLTLYEFRTTNNLIKICKEYVKQFTNSHNNMESWLNEYDFIPLKDKESKPLVEYKFAIPIWANEHIDLMLSGTIDLICSYAGMPTLLVDHKTSAMTVDEKFFYAYDWDIQPMLYCKVWKEANKLEHYPPFMINGIGCKKPTLKAEKEGVFDGVSFKRSGIIQYSDSQMKQFDIWLGRQIQKFIANLMIHGSNYDAAKDYNMAACKSIYGQCKYFGVCKLPLDMQKYKIESTFIRSHYNPLTFRD